MDKSEFARVKNEMRDWAKPYTAPISKTADGDYGEAAGTGSYIETPDQIFLITCSHVPKDLPPGWRLEHLPGPTDDYLPIPGVPKGKGWPFDACAFPVDPLPSGSEFTAIPLTSFDARYAPADKEFLFWMGYPGSTALRNRPATDGTLRKTLYGLPLPTTRYPFLSQEHIEWDGSQKAFDSAFHVAAHYPAAAQREASSDPELLLNAKGMSGSLLWDTKRVAAWRAGRPWQPSDARVCGLVFAAISDPEVVFATRIEHVRAALPQVFGSP